MVQKNTKSGVQLRTPKPKSKLGLSIPRIGLPHDELVKADSSRETELMSVLGLTSPTAMTDQAGRADTTGQTDSPSLTRHNATTSLTSMASAPASDEIVPDVEYPAIPAVVKTDDVSLPPIAREDTKPGSANSTPTTPSSLSGLTSISDVVATPIFARAAADPLPGKSRVLYAVLHGLTHGADNPTHSIRMRRTDLMRLAGIGSRNTFIANMRRLEAAGLVRQTVIVGEADGNDFHVSEMQTDGENIALTGQTMLRNSQNPTTDSVDNLTESLIAAIAQSGATPEALANALEQAARQLREGK
jgi:hypothetical protein